MIICRFVLSSLVLAIVAACGSSSSPAGGTSEGSTSASTSDTGMSATTSASTTLTGGTTSDGGTTTTTSATVDESTTAPTPDMGGREDPCTASATAFCEHFDDYTETALADGQTFGPWRASLGLPGATMDLDGTHTVSGDRALHVLLEQGTTSGGRLFASDGLPLLADAPTHLYGRMMMYIEQNGTSIHWTFFGVQGTADPASPFAGNYAAYIMSSLPREGVNTYSFVDGLDVVDYYQDCSTQGMEPMPSTQWTCVSFEMDSLARHLRMWKDDAADPIVAVDDHGAACVPPAPADSTWWGPEIDELFVGTWSFHSMDAPLEVWIDDLVVDVAPVACP